MAHRKLEIESECSPCKGSGLYVGMAERDGAAIVCGRCKGTGKYIIRLEYDDYLGRKAPDSLPERVYECNPGVMIGIIPGGCSLSDFGGMSFDDWIQGNPFPPGSEMRAFTCPAWWYQTANYVLKPTWERCSGLWGESFTKCLSFPSRHECWDKWDREHEQKVEEERQ
jgi:hypothetical protein